ncbi:mitogen-activated protein kinase kinase kinase SSK22 KNAG_0I02830 [Huiozyma naganishii CBS 8797]|uniref:Protein kinase domain-containing protein n=1 Tax=Huiozyma naganishii (strain ATCC MYA-139 / BCRC 22969 / CBS 8797 / KCTC 17520 / NBRC 10181 / NCYC 3082 / Yp74L-3) TaxID=1071383 RepID=J7S2J9_HUIN7|nr:hypothetical protein KNAG_0I02830 [Kazachstania naganishii CBS 8797]CCK72067.1 hypothetical protein KNAG_0I02830 [Kazachstania naganishii CBS 8797]
MSEQDYFSLDSPREHAVDHWAGPTDRERLGPESLQKSVLIEGQGASSNKGAGSPKLQSPRRPESHHTSFSDYPHSGHAVRPVTMSRFSSTPGVSSLHHKILTHKDGTTRRPLTNTLMTQLERGQLPPYTAERSKIRSKSLVVPSGRETRKTISLELDPSSPTLIHFSPLSREALFNYRRSSTSNPTTPKGIQYIIPSSQCATETWSPLTSIPSSRSSSIRPDSASSIGTFPTVKKQYILNEQLYLSKLKSSIPDDDYYTRRITPGAYLNVDTDDDQGEHLEYPLELNTAVNGNEDFTSTGSIVTPHAEETHFLHPDFIKQRLNSLQYSDSETTTGDILDSDMSGLITDSRVSRRIEWQRLLTSVLRGDIVKSEKTKIIKENIGTNFGKHYGYDLWLDLRAWLSGKSSAQLSQNLIVLRKLSDDIIVEILNFRVPKEIAGDRVLIVDELKNLMNKYYKILGYWPNIRDMAKDKPVITSLELTETIDTINNWLNLRTGFLHVTKHLKQWTNGGNSNFDESYELTISTALVGQLIKEKDIEKIFEKKVFSQLAPWLAKGKIFCLNYQNIMAKMNLTCDYKWIEELLLFPMRLLKEVILLRIVYAEKIKTPTMMMVDQTIENLTSYIKLAVQLKYTLVEYTTDLPFHIPFDPDFDETVLKALSLLFTFLHLKILECNKMSYPFFKEVDVLLKHWEDLKNVGQYVKYSGALIASEFSKLMLRILHRLHAYLLQQQNKQPHFKDNVHSQKWLTEFFENLGSMKKRLNRFSIILTKAFQNAVIYNVKDASKMTQLLHHFGYFLIYSGDDVKMDGKYVFGSPELLGSSSQEIINILENHDIGSDIIPRLQIENSLILYNATSPILEGFFPGDKKFRGNGSQSKLSSTSGTSKNSKFHPLPHFEDLSALQKELGDIEARLQSLGHLIIFCIEDPILWKGPVVSFSGIRLGSFHAGMKPGTMILMNQGSNIALSCQSSTFERSQCVFFMERRCSLKSVESNLQRINKAYFRLAYTVLSNVDKTVAKFRSISCANDPVNSIFVFTKDFGLNFLKTNVADPEKKSILVHLMVQMSIKWLTFLVNDCDVFDERTFRWCIPALEYAVRVLDGLNVLILDEDEFRLLKKRIASCMSLLISHFDVMGARTFETAKKLHQPRSDKFEAEHKVDDDEVMLGLNSQVRVSAIVAMEQANASRNTFKIGHVVDDADEDNRFILSLVSSLSNVSIRWQKRDFVGSGNFGTVFSAVNLDTGDILAVKEIKLHNVKKMERIYSCIKEEIEIMERLNHPNVINCYGVEVHRDKLNIFMDYCEGGSLSSLLDHGRIEDEVVTQVYSLELLEGLAYLHRSGVVHQDIKPQNILLNHNGLIKYVDFGTARKITANESASVNLDGKVLTPPPASGGTDKKFDTTVRDMIGTPMYMAPEVVSGSDRSGCYESGDIWSLGCVILEMVTGKSPWWNLENEWAIMYHVAAGHTPPLPSENEISDLGREFLERMLVADPKKRATAVELLVDPWIVQIRELAFKPNEET